MKQKISITLSSDLVQEIDRSAGEDSSRSEFLENLVRKHFKSVVREALNARDVELINQHADYLNREMEDVLRYQAPILFDTEG